MFILNNKQTMDQMTYSVLSSNLYPDLSPNTSMISEALKYLPFSLPQPFPILQGNMGIIPSHINSPNLYKQICNYNKKLVYQEFQLICSRVIQLYQSMQRNAGYFNFQQYLNQIYMWLSTNITNGNNYASYLTNKTKNYVNSGENVVQFSKYIMVSLGQIHMSYYQIPNRSSGIVLEQQYYSRESINQAKISQKYQTIIQDKLNLLVTPVNMNYFQNLIANTLQNKNYYNSYQNLKTENQVQAQRTANVMKKLLMSKYIQTNEINKQNQFQGGNTPNRFQTPNPRFAYRTEDFHNQQTLLQRNILQNLAQSIENQQLNKNKNIATHEFQLDDWMYDNISQMSYYETHMMAHMADLIFIHPDRFNIKLIRYHPYLSILNQKILQEINSIKSQLLALRIAYQSYIKIIFQAQKQKINNLEHNQFNLTQSLKYKQSEQPIKKQNNFFDKTVKALQKLYIKQKQQTKVGSNNTFECKSDETQVSDYAKQNQDIKFTHHLQKIQFQYNNILQCLQKLSQYLFSLSHKNSSQSQTKVQIQPEEKKKGFFKALMNFGTEVKQKITGQDLTYYHEFQSWIAIVIILYKQLAFNQLNNYEYTPLKRRVIINICKRIFINEKKQKKNKYSINYNGFRNWAIILKFLQNNRSQIMYDKLGIANQKAVDDILSQFYSVIRQKRMAGSTFGNMFEGLPPLKETIPSIKLVCLSTGTNISQNINKKKSSTQCKVVHILISGFLSQDTNKLQQWLDMVDIMADSQIYALVWESSTIKNLFKFFLKSAVDILGAIKMADQLHRKYTDNPFNPAFEVAQMTGRILAQIVKRTFPNRFINVCGYSLGTQVIKQFLKGMIVSKSSNMVNNVYLMGGVSDTTQFEEIICQSRTPISLYNCYTYNDSVLKHLLSLCKPEIKAIGLNQLKKVGGHSIINVDCTKFISGHLAFRSNLSIMGQVLEISTG